MPYKNLILFILILLPTLAAFRPWDTQDTLTSAIWTSTETWSDPDGDGTFIRDTITCTHDNHWVFYPDSTFLIIESGIRCASDEVYSDTISGKWALKNNQSQLSLTFPGDAALLNIHTVGSHRVELHLIDPVHPAAPAWEKVILKR